MRAFRATPHSRTDETANFLMLGRECRLPDQLVPGTHANQLTTRSTYALELKDRLESAHDLLRTQQMLPPRSANCEDEPLVNPGDVVLVGRKHKKKGVNPKLQSKFEGPFVIKKAFSNGTYKVMGRGTVNECRLKLFEPCPDPEGQAIEPAQTLPEVGPDSVLVNEPDRWSSAFSDVPAGEPLTTELETDPNAEPCQLDEARLPVGRQRRTRKIPSRFDDYVVY